MTNDVGIPEPQIDGACRSDTLTRQLYSTDASIYQIEPEYIIFPSNSTDVQRIVNWAQKHEMSLTPRGSGTSLSGQAIGHGAVVDYSRHLNEILSIDPQDTSVTVEPGVVLDTLNESLAEHGLRFGPDVATSNRATIGGMIGNNSAGAHSIRYGHTSDHINSLRCLLSNGEEVVFKPVSREKADEIARGDSLEAKLYREIPDRIQAHAEQIRKRFPDISRNVSGYGVNHFLDKLEQGIVDFTQIICGSEGTLATVLEADLNLVSAPGDTGLLTLNCDSFASAMKANQLAIKHDPYAVELLDQMILDLAADSLETSRHLDWMQGDPRAVIIVEVTADTESGSIQSRLDFFKNLFRSNGFNGKVNTLTNPEDQADVWKVRKSGLPLLLGIPGDRKPTTFIEDTAVDPSRLVEYVNDFQQLVEKHGTTAAFYGHSSVGCLHIRPLINLKSAEDIENMRSFAKDAVDLVIEHGGAISGEHGDGRARSEWLPQFYGDEIVSLFRDIKHIFDPENRLNPGNVVDPEPMHKNLRYGPEYQANSVDTVQDFTEQGGFNEIIERCNGSGVCRKESSGTMCPSYMVTDNEKHSTRGRANALRGIISGDLDPDALTDGRMESVMDLCISCKACKSECPSEVDMAPLKEEVMHTVHQESGVRVRDRIFGEVGWIARAIESFQPLPNLLQNIPAGEWILKKFTGISNERSLPHFDPEPFDFQDDPLNDDSLNNPIVLYVDTFSGYMEPEIARSAKKILERLGFDVVTPRIPCCGRPLMSKGLLDRANEQVSKTLETLKPYAKRDMPIVGLEPSCVSALTDDYPRYQTSETAEKVAEKTHLFSEFVADNLNRLTDSQSESLNSQFDNNVLIHGHCHQKALLGTEAVERIFTEFTTGSVDLIDSGCCGMAGSFGFEQEHYEQSRQMGERRLLPAVRSASAETKIVAAGTSCRQQIDDFSDRSADHPAPLLASVLPPRNGE